MSVSSGKGGSITSEPTSKFGSSSGGRFTRILGIVLALATAVCLAFGVVAFADEPAASDAAAPAAASSATDDGAVVCTDFASFKAAMSNNHVTDVILRGPIDEVLPSRNQPNSWGHAIYVSGHKELTIEGTCIFTGAEDDDLDVSEYASLLYVYSTSSLSIKGDGELLWLSSAGKYAYNAVIHNFGELSVSGASIAGGNVLANSYCRAISQYGGSLVINGGKFVGMASKGAFAEAVYASEGTTEINSGIFKCAILGGSDSGPACRGVTIEPSDEGFESAVLRGGEYYGISLLPTTSTLGDYVDYMCVAADEEGNDIPLDTPSTQLSEYGYVKISSLKVIDMVSFEGETPEPGVEIMYDVESMDPAQYNVVPGSIDWYDVTDGLWTRPGDVFEVGHTYRLDMYIEADEYYVFARNENGQTGVLGAYNGSKAECFDLTDGTDNRVRIHFKWETTLEAPAVYSVSGQVTSQGDEGDPITMHLIPEGYTEVAYELIVTGNNVQYCFTDVAEGSYVLKVSKPGHVTSEYDVIVDGESVVQNCELVLIEQPEPVIPYSDLWKSFPDVKKEVEKAGGPEKVWYVADGWLDYVVYAGLMSGYSSNGWFGPYDNITRGQVAVILYRAECAFSPSLPGIFGSTTDPAQYAKTCAFKDMEAGVYYTAAVNWAKDAGILTGDASTGYTTVRPNDPVSRQELCVMLDRYVNGSTSKGELDPGVGEDIVGMEKVADWAKGSVNWCVNHGIIYGVDNHDGTYSMDPTGKTWRSAAAKMFTVVMRDIVGL